MVLPSSGRTNVKVQVPSDEVHTLPPGPTNRCELSVVITPHATEGHIRPEDIEGDRGVERLHLGHNIEVGRSASPKSDLQAVESVPASRAPVETQEVFPDGHLHPSQTICGPYDHAIEPLLPRPAALERRSGNRHVWGDHQRRHDAQGQVELAPHIPEHSHRVTARDAREHSSDRNRGLLHRVRAAILAVAQLIRARARDGVRRHARRATRGHVGAGRDRAAIAAVSHEVGQVSGGGASELESCRHADDDTTWRDRSD
mmetsp:Transcript_54012/g.164103  ORF Transcript_54012/g.164103 Transcript_54012/m.164103 type:complete len:258 (+) Transcript_54012:424-1197(+)